MHAADTLRLYTFRVSHFSEKVRWALDLESIAYKELALLPGLHLLSTHRLGNASTVPILQHGARAIQGSGSILDYLKSELGLSRLAPRPELAARCAELEGLADHAIGHGVQRIVYAELLQNRRTIVDLWTVAHPVWSRAFYAFAYPVVAAGVKRLYKTTPDAVARAKSRFAEAMGEFDAALRGQRYLMGDELTRADITLAALLAPLCRPPEHCVAWPELPSALRAFTRDFEGSRAWNHALDMYRTQRPKPSSAK